MERKKTITGLPGSLDRIRVFNLIDRACELSVKKGPHPFDMDCPCLACMTKRKKRLYPMSTDWPYSL
jgi:hypothetical protein